MLIRAAQQTCIWHHVAIAVEVSCKPKLANQKSESTPPLQTCQLILWLWQWVQCVPLLGIYTEDAKYSDTTHCVKSEAIEWAIGAHFLRCFDAKEILWFCLSCLESLVLIVVFGELGKCQVIYTLSAAALSNTWCQREYIIPKEMWSDQRNTDIRWA